MSSSSSSSARRVDAEEEAIYHEKQYGSMCGQHCLNNLLQGPYFKPDDLAEIAHELDEMERHLMGGSVRGGATTSNNVDDSGNFSIQVLSTALDRFDQINLVQDSSVLNSVLARLNRDDADLSEDVAFVCNLANHWFTIRSIRCEIWDLNSLKKRPSLISLFYLSAYLGQLREEGYSIFVVQGNIPRVGVRSMGKRSDWFVPGVDDVGVSDEPPRPMRLDDVDDPDLRAALRASMGSSSSVHSDAATAGGRYSTRFYSDANDFGDDDAELQAALAASLGKGDAMYDNDSFEQDAEDDEEEMVKRAIAASLKDSRR